jgi:anaphase-promoting complex subunit 10
MAHFLFKSITNDDSMLNFSSETKKDKQEIGDQAVWSLSSAKPGFGVEQLRDDNLDTYWQSDGAQPHFINIQFNKRMNVEEICFYANFKLDESYTPSKISIRSGTTFHDLQEIKVVELEGPVDWVTVPLTQLNGSTLKTNLVQVAIISNHQNGRDTHIRQIKIYGPRESVATKLKLPSFSSPEFSAYSVLR